MLTTTTASTCKIFLLYSHYSSSLSTLRLALLFVAMAGFALQFVGRAGCTWWMWTTIRFPRSPLSCTNSQMQKSFSVTWFHLQKALHPPIHVRPSFQTATSPCHDLPCGSRNNTLGGNAMLWSLRTSTGTYCSGGQRELLMNGKN